MSSEETPPLCSICFSRPGESVMPCKARKFRVFEIDSDSVICCCCCCCCCSCCSCCAGTAAAAAAGGGAGGAVVVFHQN